jgi:hypothetical protein
MVPRRAWLFALVVVIAAVHPANAQVGPSQCNDFVKLRADAEQKGAAIRSAQERKAERKEICTLIQRFAVAEGSMIKFLETNKLWCGVPDQAIKQAKANHAKTLKVRTAACDTNAIGQGPRPKQPTLSDALGTPSVDTPDNTKTGRGTFDTLTGSPLAR